MGCSTLAGTRLTIPQAVSYAQEAGFSGKPLAIIVAVAQAESALYTHAVNSCDPYGGSFGVLQLNGSHFGDKFGPNNQYTMSQAAAFDPQLSFLFAWPLSNYGKDFSPWGSFSNGGYLQYLSATQDAIGASGGGGGSSSDLHFPDYSGTPWYDFDIKSDLGYGNPPSTYNNTDVETPPDTPITAPLAGTITQGGYFDWGGQWTIKVDNPSAINGHRDYFVIHLDALNPNLKVGQHIEQGTFLGYSGGETSLSDPRLQPLPPFLQHHITLPSHSSGPHLDIGVTDDDSGSMDRDKQASDALVELARQGAIPFSTAITGGSGVGNFIDTTGGGNAPSAGEAYPLAIHNTLVQNPGFYGISKALDEASNFPGWIGSAIPSVSGPTDWTDLAALPGGVLQAVSDTIIGNAIPVFFRGLLIVTGLFLVLALLWQLAKPNLEALPSLLQVQRLSALATA